MAEEARLESVYTPKGYREFESPSLRKAKIIKKSHRKSDAFLFLAVAVKSLLL